MRAGIRIIYTATLAVLWLLGANPVQAEHINASMRVEEEWGNSISESCIQETDTEDLLEIVLNYPFISGIYAEDNISDGIDLIRSNYAPLSEFLTRCDALIILQEYITSCEEAENSTETCQTIQFFVAKRLQKYLLTAISNEDYWVDPLTGWLMTNVYTPAQTAVAVYYELTYEDHGITYAEASAATASFVTNYSATLIGPAAPQYNCHSYAWYLASTENQYWMRNPNAYMADGSYHEVAVPSVGCKVTYKNGTELKHSGIVTAISNSTVYVKSKWGIGGLLVHTLYNNMYYQNGATNVQYWAPN